MKSLASGGPYVASGGADDLIHIYDLRHDKDLGFLMNPGEGAITALQFFTPRGSFAPTHLLSGCVDGSLSIWAAGQGWQCMKTLRGHRHEITGIAVHFTGLLALTTSRDKTLRLWDLVKGRTTYSSKLEKEADGVLFSPSGTKYALRAGSRVTVLPVQHQEHAEGDPRGGAVLLDHPRRVTCFVFGSSDDIMITGSEDGTLRAWDISKNSPSIVLQLDKAHATRIKAVAVPRTVPPAGDAAKEEGPFPAHLATASSDGEISLWKIRDAVNHAEKTASPIQVASQFRVSVAKTNARLTTLCVTDSKEMMDILAQELASVARTKKNTQKKHRKKNTTVEQTERHHVAKQKRKIETPRGLKGQSTNARLAIEPAACSTVIDGERVVSFISEQDKIRAAKQKKRVEINAKRAATFKKQKRPKT